jgi:AcrR family transcriptional regulator
MNAVPTLAPATPSTLSSRQVKADEVRRRLFQAGAELLAAKGYHATSVAEIAQRAGVAKGTFFLYFPTKDALVTELVRVQVRLVSAERTRLIEDGTSPAARLRATMLALGRLTELNMARAIFAAIFDKADVGGTVDLLFQDLLKMMTEDARAAIAAGELSRKTDADGFALLLMDSFLGATVSYATSPRGRSLTQMISSHVDMNLAAFAPQAKAKKPARTRPARKP